MLHSKEQLRLQIKLRFPHNSVVKESTCNEGDPSLIPGSGRSAGEWIGYPLQYSWAFLVAQLVKNPPAMWETWVQSLGWEDPVEGGKATHSSILAWIIPWTIADKESACNVGDLGSIPGLGRSNGEGKSYPLQYSGLENSMDSVVRGITKNQTRLSDFLFQRVYRQSVSTVSSQHFKQHL